jgi:hypothetical protein
MVFVSASAFGSLERKTQCHPLINLKARFFRRPVILRVPTLQKTLLLHGVGLAVFFLPRERMFL